MWTNKQVWEFEEINENLTFDMLYVEPGKYDENLWKSKVITFRFRCEGCSKLEHLIIYLRVMKNYGYQVKETMAIR